MLQHLEEVLQRLGEYSLKLKMSKCKLFQRKQTYLGHVVSAAGVELDPEKTKVLEDWPLNPPKNSQQHQTFLGFAGYYRSFVKNFVKIAETLYHLVGGRPPRGRKTPRFLWTERCQEAFECLISCLTSPPILGYPDFQLPFTVHVDASSTGRGAAQTQKGRPTVIAYGSRTLSPAERNYSAYRREFLALKWAVAEKFRDYLYGSRFHVVTDSNPLTYLVTSAKLSPTDHHWLSLTSKSPIAVAKPVGTPMDSLVSLLMVEEVIRTSILTNSMSDPSWTVAHCGRCIRRKAPDPPRAPMKSFIAKELACVAGAIRERGER